MQRSTAMFHSPPARCSCRIDRILLAVVGLVAATAVSHPLQAGRYYSIRMGDKLIGYATVDGHQEKRDGQAVTRLESTTSIKVAVLGKPRKILIQSSTILHAATGAPQRLSLTITVNDHRQHFDAEMADGHVSIWNYTAEDERGSPTKIDVPQGTLFMGSNVFAHWDLILRAASQRVQNDIATVPVVMPESGQVKRLQLRRAGTKKVQLLGESVEVVVWKLEESDLELWADAQHAYLVRMNLPSQRTVIELTEQSVAKQLEKTQAEEVLSDLFARSNVRFDDFLAVRMLRVRLKARVLGEGLTNDPSVLQTPMQQFDGTKQGAVIEGTFVIRSQKYSPGDSPIMGDRVPDSLKKWTRPGQYIESDDAAVSKLARDLVASCKTRWDAVRSIGEWVYQNIRYTIADTPSATLALQTKQGDCGPHSTLMVAMLRSVGIPARLVGGLVYTPTFGGSFGQHAWVEVHMGPAGWVAVDPTTGEFDTLSAVHIKLFEGLGGAHAETLEVLAYQPPNRKSSTAVPKQIRPFPWKLGVPHRFRYTQGEQVLVDETFTFRSVTHQGEKALELQDSLKLTINDSLSLTSDTRLVVRPDIRPLLIDRTFKTTRETKVACRFQEDKVIVEISGSRKLKREIDVPKNVYCFDNNLTASFALICSQLQLEIGKPLRIDTYHPSSLQVIPLTITPKAKETIDVTGEQIECFRCKVDPIGNTFWISTGGRLVKVTQGNLTIELLKSSAEKE